MWHQAKAWTQGDVVKKVLLIKIAKKDYLSDLEHGVAVGATGSSISKTVNLLGFSHTRVYSKWNGRETSDWQCQRSRARLYWAERKVTVTQITTRMVSFWSHGSFLPSIIIQAGADGLMMWDIVLWHTLVPIETTGASFKHHSLPEYCGWPSPSPVRPRRAHLLMAPSSGITCHKSQTGFLNMTMSLLYPHQSPGLNPIQHCCNVMEKICSNFLMLSCQYGPKSIFSTLFNLCREELRLFLKSKSGQSVY